MRALSKSRCPPYRKRVQSGPERSRTRQWARPERTLDGEDHFDTIGERGQQRDNSWAEVGQINWNYRDPFHVVGSRKLAKPSVLIGEITCWKLYQAQL
jgi:hypothetical protein